MPEPSYNEPTQGPETQIVKIKTNGNEVEVIATADPHSFYTILNKCPKKDLLGNAIEIALKNGKKVVYGRVVEEPICINDHETAGQIIYVDTFPTTIIGWKQLHDLGWMQANKNRGFVIDVPPVLIQGDRNPYSDPQSYLKKHLLDDARRVIASWLRQGLIEHCNSVCNSRISLTVKRNKKVKIIFDFTKLNDCSEKEPTHPQVNRPKAIEEITLGKYYSFFKLFYGEWQIPLDTYTKYKTAFTFLGKQYVWNRLPGKFQNTTNRLSHALEKVLGQLPENMRKRVTYYIDTILISAETKEECGKFTEKLERLLKDNSFEIRQKQCRKCKPVVQFLGREITGEGVRLGKDFIQKVRNMTLPRNVQELQSILCCLQDAMQYTPGYGIFSKSLSKLTSKNREFHWNSKSEAALVGLITKVLQNRFVVPGLAKKEACTVQIFVKDGAWMAEILNSARKPYRYESGIFRPLKKKDSFAIQELKAMKEVWNKHVRVLESRDVQWEVESPDIARYKDNPDSIPNKNRLNLDFLKTQRFKIQVVHPSVHKPSIPWPQNL